MPIPTKRAVPEQPVFTAGKTVEVRLQKGYLEESLTVHMESSAIVTAPATSVVARGALLREYRLLTDQNEVLQAWKAHDAVIEQLLYEGNLDTNQITSPTGVANATYPVKSTHTISLREPFAGKLGDLTMLPSWIYQALTLQLVFGDTTDIFVGGTVALGATTVTVSQNGVIDYPTPREFNGDVNAFGRALGKAYKAYDENSPTGAKNPFNIDVPLTADIRSMMILAYNASGVLDDSIIADVTLKVNNNTEIVSHVPWQALRGENQRVFGIPIPAGIAVLESAEDKDITHIYEVTGYSKATLQLNVTAAGLIRVAYRKLAAGRG